MRGKMKSEMISRRGAFSLLGLAAAASLLVPVLGLLTVSDAEAQTTTHHLHDRVPLGVSCSPTGSVPQRAQERRTGRTERRASDAAPPLISQKGHGGRFRDAVLPVLTRGGNPAKAISRNVRIQSPDPFSLSKAQAGSFFYDWRLPVASARIKQAARPHPSGAALAGGYRCATPREQTSLAGSPQH